MDLKATLMALDRETEAAWLHELEVASKALPGAKLEVVAGTEADGQIVFVDARLRDLDRRLEAIDRRGRAVFLVVEQESRGVPSALIEGKVDDVLVHPFRALELQSKIRHYQQILMWDEVSELNASFSELISELHEDLKLAERLQKGSLPARFPDVKGFKVTSRYAAGSRSGGDHFDLAESKDGQTLSMVLSDASSYGLSSAVLGALMRVANKLSADSARSSSDTVARIRDEVLATLKEKDRLSLFYGVLSRRDYKLRYLNLGTSCAYYARAGKRFEALPSQGDPINKTQGVTSFREAELSLEPGSRLILLSDGFAEALKGSAQVQALLDQLRGKEPVDTLNELIFQLKSTFAEDDDMPPQDCTGVVFDVDTRLIRLAG